MARGGRVFPVRGATFPCVRTPSNPHIAYSHCPVSCALAPRAPLLSIDSSIAAALCPREILSFHHDSCVMTSATRMMSASVTASASSHVLLRYLHWVPSSCAARSSSPMASWWSRSPSQSLSCEWLATGGPPSCDLRTFFPLFPNLLRLCLTFQSSWATVPLPPSGTSWNLLSELLGHSRPFWFSRRHSS